MTSSRNKYGLSRNIPSDIKRTVRQRCGFGCVSCGKGIVQYDHFSPEFADATLHLAEGITLLCGACHDEKKHGLLTNGQVEKMNAEPYCLQNGSAFGSFRLTGDQPIVLLGTTEFRNCKVILEVAGERVIWFTKPETEKEGLQLNARIRDDAGNVVFEVLKNEWTVGGDVWDMDTSGNGIVVRSRPRQFELILRFLPPETIKVERLRLRNKRTTVRIEKDGSIVDEYENRFVGCAATNCYTGIRFKAPGNIQFGCGRPSWMDFWVRLWITTAIVPAGTLGSKRA
jgi:hypothetical protein